jgi:GWxTD domain-containing protein
MRQKIVILALACFVLWGWGFASQEEVKLSSKERDTVLKNIDMIYRNWWDMVYHISSSEERDVFLKLKNNRERDIFIRTFWLQRDPTPGTDENEYKNEIEERFAYVNKYFSRGTSRPGWMTDPGRFYMILGKPSSISRYDNKAGLYPAQIWYYYGDPSLGLPTFFTVTFFKPHNTTEWKLYNPSVDGPAALMINQGPVDETDFEGLYNKIRELAPELAMPAITMIPNEVAPGYRPLLRNNIILSNIYESPKRKVNISYASHFLNYKGYVDVESSINYVENTHLVSITRYQPFGLNFVNISFKPTRISVGYDEDTSRYFFNFDVSVSLRKGETYVYEYKKKFDFYIEPNRVDALKSNGIVIHDSFPVIPGQYKVMVYAMNSVGKEFTYFEKDIKVAPLDNTPVLATPVIGYKSELQADNFFFTYRFGDKKLFVDTGKNLRLKEKPLVLIGAYNLTREMWEKGKVEIELKGLSERRKFKKTYGVPLNQYTYRKDLNALYRLGEDVGGLDPDYYELEVKLLDGTGKLRDSRQAQFGISPLAAIAYPMETFKQVRADNPYFFYYNLAQQFYNIGNTPEAAKYYARAIESNPDFKEGLVAYLTVLNQQKKYTQVMVEVEKLKDDPKFSFDYHLVKATALFGMKDYNEALTHLVKANTIYDSDVRVLNLLGFTFLNLNDYQEALKAFAASLGLDDKQDFIKKTVAQVKIKMDAKSNVKNKSQ